MSTVTIAEEDVASEALAAVSAHGTARHREHVEELVEQTEYDIAALVAANILEEVGAPVPENVAALAEITKAMLRR